MPSRSPQNPETNPEAYPEDYVRMEFGSTAQEPPQGPMWPTAPRFWTEKMLRFLISWWVVIPFWILAVVLSTWLWGALSEPLGDLTAMVLTAGGVVGLGVIYWSTWWMLTHRPGRPA